MVFSKNRQFRVRKIGKQILLLGSNYALAINETTESIWSMIDGINENESIARQISEIYNIDYDSAFNDVAELMHELESEGVIIRTA